MKSSNVSFPAFGRYFFTFTLGFAFGFCLVLVLELVFVAVWLEVFELVRVLVERVDPVGLEELLVRLRVVDVLRDDVEGVEVPEVLLVDVLGEGVGKS